MMMGPLTFGGSMGNISVENIRIALCGYLKDQESQTGFPDGYFINSVHLFTYLLSFRDRKEFIKNAYGCILLREPDETGYRHFSRGLRFGLPRAFVINSFLKSEEYALCAASRLKPLRLHEMARVTLKVNILVYGKRLSFLKKVPLVGNVASTAYFIIQRGLIV
jgi:hypothetical protein